MGIENSVHEIGSAGGITPHNPLSDKERRNKRKMREDKKPAGEKTGRDETGQDAPDAPPKPSAGGDCGIDYYA